MKSIHFEARSHVPKADHMTKPFAINITNVQQKKSVVNEK